MVLTKAIALYGAAAALAFGVVAGYKVRDWQCDAAFSKALEEAQRKREQTEKVVYDISEVYEDGRNQANIVATERTNTIREIYKAAPPISVNCAAPDNVRRLLESGVRDANAASTGKPSGELPTSTQPTSFVD